MCRYFLLVLALFFLFACTGLPPTEKGENKTDNTTAVVVNNSVPVPPANQSTENKYDTTRQEIPSNKSSQPAVMPENKCPFKPDFDRLFGQDLAGETDNGFSYLERETIKAGKYSADFEKGIRYDTKLARVNFLGKKGWYITEVYPPACWPTSRYILRPNQSISLGNYTIRFESMRLGVCPTCPPVSKFLLSANGDEFEREFVPLSGQRFRLGGQQALAFQVTDAKFSGEQANVQAEFTACVDEGGHVTLARGTPRNTSLNQSIMKTQGYTVKLENVYWGADNLQHADLEFYDSAGELEGRLYNVKQYETYTWYSKNGTIILIHIFDPLVVNEGKKAPPLLENMSDELTLRDGGELCGYNVSLEWASLGGRDEPDALRRITLAKQ